MDGGSGVPTAATSFAVKYGFWENGERLKWLADSEN